jgi:hypothetical protein
MGHSWSIGSWLEHFKNEYLEPSAEARIVLIRMAFREGCPMIRKLASGKYRLYSRKRDPKTGRRRNLGTFSTRAAAQKHERAVQFFKRAG